MERLLRLVVCLVVVAAATAASATAADNGNAPATLSFFSSGGGAHAGWLHTEDQPAVDTDYQQAMQIHVTPTGYAGVLVHHVYGWLTADFPNSSFDFKSNLIGPSNGYPRLVILFSDGGNAVLRPLSWKQNWTTVADPDWDNMAGGTCVPVFQYEQTWQQIQACHPGTFITNAYITTDPGIEVDFLIDNLNVAAKHFSSASDNSNGDNTSATFTPDLLSLLSGSLVD